MISDDNRIYKCEERKIINQNKNKQKHLETATDLHLRQLSHSANSAYQKLWYWLNPLSTLWATQ